MSLNQIREKTVPISQIIPSFHMSYPYPILFSFTAPNSSRSYREVREAIIRRRHEPVPALGKWLRSVIQGHFNYFAVPGNRKAVDRFRTEINRAWLFALRRRSQKSRNLTWDRIKRLIKTWIPHG